MKSVKVVCDHALSDIQLETLRDNQLNIASISSPVGIESELMSTCTVYEIERKGEETNIKEIGFIKAKIALDEGRMHTEYEASENVLKFARRLLF